MEADPLNQIVGFGQRVCCGIFVGAGDWVLYAVSELNTEEVHINRKCDFPSNVPEISVWRHLGVPSAMRLPAPARQR